MTGPVRALTRQYGLLAKLKEVVGNTLRLHRLPAPGGPEKP
jgi:hypothetical protein